MRSGRKINFTRQDYSEQVGKIDIESLPLCHELGPRRQAEVREVKDGALELLGVDLVAPGLGVGRHLIVDVLDLELLRGRRKNHGRARKALLELLQFERVGGALERRVAELLELLVRDNRKRLCCLGDLEADVEVVDVLLVGGEDLLKVLLGGGEVILLGLEEGHDLDRRHAVWGCT